MNLMALIIGELVVNINSNYLGINTRIKGTATYDAEVAGLLVVSHDRRN